MKLHDDINDILTDRETMLMAAWMLPNDGTLSDAQRKQAMDNFVAYLRKHNITQRQVAHQLGTPRETTIADLVHGQYRSNSDAHVRKLNMWVEQNARMRAASMTETFVTTTKVAKDMMTVARLVREGSTMGLCFGPTGIGKTRCAEAISEKFVGSILVRVLKAYQSPNGITKAIASAIGVRRSATRNEPHRSLCIERVIDTLRESHRLLILDEAHRLRDDAIEQVRDIHDETGIPILMLATRDLHDRILRNASPDQGQQYSRISVVRDLTAGFDVHAGGKVLHTIDDIRTLYQEPPIRLAQDAARYLQDVANMLGYGSLRRCKSLLQNAIRKARKEAGLGDGAKVTVRASHLEWVERSLRHETSERNLIQDRRRRTAVAAGG